MSSMSNISSSPSLLKKQANILHRSNKQDEQQCLQKETNDMSQATKSTEIKDDTQDERVPCEFCGDLRCKEAIMRHQVINLNEVAKNYTNLKVEYLFANIHWSIECI